MTDSVVFIASTTQAFACSSSRDDRFGKFIALTTQALAPALAMTALNTLSGTVLGV
jgi:hypothetical protein